MLYNKDWNKPKVTPIDPLSLDDLIAWLETKNPNEGYHFTDADHCMLAQWVRHLDPKAHHAPTNNNSYVYQVHGKRVNFQFSNLARAAGSGTFGGALLCAKLHQGRT